ncbi:hypothetical protein WQ49_21940 [Burkholderia cenocepacia]|nr:hypothetical protein WQ49_21940 [Burkholderia cenocepacia]
MRTRRVARPRSRAGYWKPDSWRLLVSNVFLSGCGEGRTRVTSMRRAAASRRLRRWAVVFRATGAAYKRTTTYDDLRRIT